MKGHQVKRNDDRSAGCKIGPGKTAREISLVHEPDGRPLCLGNAIPARWMACPSCGFCGGEPVRVRSDSCGRRVEHVECMLTAEE